MSEALLHDTAEMKTETDKPSKLVLATFAFFFCAIAAIVIGEVIGLLFR